MVEYILGLLDVCDLLVRGCLWVVVAVLVVVVVVLVVN